MAPIRRLWLLLGLNLSMAVILPPILLGSGHGVADLLGGWAFALVYTNVTGIPAVMAGPFIVEWLARRRWPPTAAVLASTLFFVAAGCLASQALLMWTGVAVPGSFWRQYLQTLSGAVLLAIVFGLGAVSYASMRDQLRRTEAKLHEREVAQARAEQLVAEARLRSLESRLHPHFLFNTLNSISALIRIDPAQAERMVGRLSGLLRASLDTSSSSLIPLAQELEMVEDYVDIERARFGDKLRGRVEVPPELRDAQVPPLSVQSLVENAVKHGITPQRGGGEILVSASADQRQLTIEVSDTGGGFDLTALRSGHGLDSLVRRLDTLFSAEARLDVSRRDGRCVVHMVLPRS
jgi:two-component system, LytTR family, sensor histidine kinase AlgZ